MNINAIQMQSAGDTPESFPYELLRSDSDNYIADNELRLLDLDYQKCIQAPMIKSLPPSTAHVAEGKKHSRFYSFSDVIAGLDFPYATIDQSAGLDDPFQSPRATIDESAGLDDPFQSPHEVKCEPLRDLTPEEIHTICEVWSSASPTERPTRHNSPMAHTLVHVALSDNHAADTSS
ncbi:MAG: uncharacterized protein KVP18_003193 [Porospora cf. gigantea A]|uniref:uncharacterized protein n=1 Tax=Porospora cf. gigantea A TaxID=2853593 RepID=UPI003559B7E9|nr:MAG: hypothetical protein KVP18_003193 [Porospora cf. gigantea A]